MQELFYTTLYTSWEIIALPGRGIISISLSPRPGVQSQYFCRARPTSDPLLKISAFPGRLFIGFPFLPSAARAPISSWGAWPTRRSSPSGTTRSPSTTWRGRRTCRSTSGSAGRAPKGETVREREREGLERGHNSDRAHIQHKKRLRNP